MEEKDILCKYASTCKYGVYLGHHNVCDYIGMTGESRFHNGVKGEIVNGKCGYYDRRPNERTRSGAKDRIASKEKKRHVL